ncbi:MAG TPA: NADH-quinone oxidoreductase subunit L [Vicinamibacterales bacterium]|nr:NADH-quinone oxidoreductase subunit L [Vicinamibacterales bacterium]
MDLIWLIPLVPGLGALVNGVVGIRFFSRRTSGLLACGTMAIALGLALAAFAELLGLPPEARVHDVVLFDWIPPIPLITAGGEIARFHVPWALRLDPLSALMILVVTLVGFLIHVYSTSYMADEPRGSVARYFSYLNLFCFFMLTLVLGANFLVLFVGWEGVGLCSYLLIGYWYQKKSAADAGKKAFITNRVGDFGFLLGILLVFFTFGTLDFREVAAAAASWPVETATFGTISLITILLFVGATGKSAQIPLYVWLPDAMEGPTPVSALIHAATMVTAGVYMVGRNAVLFSHAPMTMEVVAVVGVLTALLAASIGLVQTDIKRVLAYSTVSQLGFMFLAMGVGAFAAGAFHLMTHAFFKALLFLCSGAVIHGMAGEQNMLKMGGLRKHMPLTFATMMIGTLAIAGIPPLSGFFSKDEILYRAFLSSRLLWGLAAFAALMTAFYMFRLMSLTFLGAYRGRSWEVAGAHAVAEGGAHGVVHPGDPFAHGAAHRPDHEVSHGPADAATTGHAGHADDDAHGHGAWHGPHEAPRPMTFVLAALAVGAVLAGFVGVPAALGGGNAIEHFLEPSFAAHTAVSHAGQPGAPAALPAPSGDGHAAQAGVTGGGGHGEPAHLSRGAELALMAVSVAIGVIGILVAWRVYVRRPEISARLAMRFAGPHRVLTNKYYVDELYDATVIRGTMSGANGLWAFDRQVVDGAVNGSGWMTIISSWLSHLVDKYLVDGLVNVVGSAFRESSFVFRRLQTGLIQNYALLMLVGVFAFVSLYLLVR